MHTHTHTHTCHNVEFKAQRPVKTAYVITITLMLVLVPVLLSCEQTYCAGYVNQLPIDPNGGALPNPLPEPIVCKVVPYMMCCRKQVKLSLTVLCRNLWCACCWLAVQTHLHAGTACKAC